MQARCLFTRGGQTLLLAGLAGLAGHKRKLEKKVCLTEKTKQSQVKHHQTDDLHAWMSSSYGSERSCGSRQRRRWPKWSMPQEMLQQSDSPSKIITGCSETREYKRSSFTSHVILLVCVFLHLTWCFFVFALLLEYQRETRREGFTETEIQVFHYVKTRANSETNQTQLHSYWCEIQAGDLRCASNF